MGNRRWHLFCTGCLMLIYQKKIFCVVITMILVIALGCNYFKPSNEAIGEVSMNDSSPGGTQLTDTLLGGDRDTMILVKNNEAYIKGLITESKPILKYTLPAWDNQVVTAIVTSSPRGNKIEIKNLQLPGGDLTGPFGDSLSYRLEKNGNLYIIIGEKSKAKGIAKTDFTLHVTIK